MLQHEIAHRKAFGQRRGGRKKDVLQQLQIAVVAQRQVGHEQRDLVGNALQAVALAAHDLEDVGILLVGHDARSGGQLVGERHEAEVLAHVEADVHGEAPQRGGHGGHGRGGGAFALAAAHLRRHDVVVQVGEPQQPRGHRPIQRERRAVAGRRPQRILIGHVVGGRQQSHVVHQRLGIGAEPQPERRGHRHL